MLQERETRPISQEQLVKEVKGIYAGLVMAESKAIEVDTVQSSVRESRLNDEQWQALVSLHRTLLHEHHDFFLASQHPSASPARRLASQYAMSGRMWRHDIHSFLERVRHRFPYSLYRMLVFSYLSYDTPSLPNATVSAGREEIWVKRLGGLGRYRCKICRAEACMDSTTMERLGSALRTHSYQQSISPVTRTGRAGAVLARTTSHRIIGHACTSW